MSYPCAVAASDIQYQHEVSVRDVQAEALFDECEEAVKNEPSEDLFMELASGTTHEIRQANALDSMGEFINEIFAREPHEVIAYVEGYKIYLRDQLIAARGES